MPRVLKRTLAVLLALAPAAGTADRGALTLEGGGVLSAVQVPPPVGFGDSVRGSLAGVTVAVRYALINHLELRATAIWGAEEAFYNNNVTLPNPNGGQPLLGQLQSRMGRLSITGGGYYATGTVWRLLVGGELGWARTSFRRLALVDVTNPAGAVAYNISIPNQPDDALALVPLVGVEWQLTDRVSVLVMARGELFLGKPTCTALTIPLVVSYSWYGLL